MSPIHRPQRPNEVDSSIRSGRLNLTPRTPDHPGKFEGEPAIAIAFHAALAGGQGDDSACLASGRTVEFIRAFSPTDLSAYAISLAIVEASGEGTDYDPMASINDDILRLTGLPVAIEETELGFVRLHYGRAAVQAIHAVNELALEELEAGL